MSKVKVTNQERLKQIEKLVFEYIDECSLEESSKLYDLLKKLKTDAEIAMVNLDDEQFSQGSPWSD